MVNLNINKAFLNRNKVFLNRYILRARLVLLGNREKSGILVKFVTLFFLVNIAIIYLNPLFYMISTSLKDVPDIIDATVGLIPKHPTLKNIEIAFKGLEFLKALGISIAIVLPTAVGHVISCAIAGYAFARLTVPGKRLLMIILVITFVIPPQTIIIPTLITFKALYMINSPMPFIIPAFFGHGLKGALFVIIYMQYFKNQPSDIENAARIDGASAFQTFWRVMFPIARPAMIVVFLFSTIWHWNETFLYLIYCPTFRPLSLRISDLKLLGISTFVSNYVVKNAISAGEVTNETVMMAGCLLVILPMILLYLFAQKWFTQGIERTGLVE